MASVTTWPRSRSAPRGGKEIQGETGPEPVVADLHDRHVEAWELVTEIPLLLASLVFLTALSRGSGKPSTERPPDATPPPSPPPGVGDGIRLDEPVRVGPPGVGVGRDAVVAAGAVVAEDVPAAGLVTGGKATVRRQR